VSKAQLKSLLTKIDGEGKLKKVLRSFYQEMSQDVLVGFFFSGKDLDAIAHQQAQFLLFAAGLKSTYLGRTPTHAHLGLPPISKGQFDRRLEILKQVLEKHGFEPHDIQIWTHFEEAFRNTVVSP